MRKKYMKKVTRIRIKRLKKVGLSTNNLNRNIAFSTTAGSKYIVCHDFRVMKQGDYFHYFLTTTFRAKAMFLESASHF